MENIREDLSDWVFHFIHDYTPDAYVAEMGVIDFEHYKGYPYHEVKETNDRFHGWGVSERHYFNDDDEDPFALQVLLKIIHDGHIKADWAFTNDRPTIYGPRAAVCFTEMPLRALPGYLRENLDFEPYAIGFYKHELFQAGARPVIYGLTGNHVEQGDKPWPRKLAPSCGIAESEQYRYVAMSPDPMNPTRTIDESHVREWRWADHQDQCSCPGVPIWLSEEPTWFTRVLVVVPDTADMERVLNRLKELHDAGSNDAAYLFSRRMLGATAVVALDRLEQELGNRREGHLCLDNISASYIKGFERPKAPRPLVEKARKVLDEARIAALHAASHRYSLSPRTRNGNHVAGVAGCAYLVVRGGQTPLVSALLELNAIYPVHGEGYYFRDIGGFGWSRQQALSLAEASVEGGKEVFEKHFPEASFDIVSRQV